MGRRSPRKPPGAMSPTERRLHRVEGDQEKATRSVDRKDRPEAGGEDRPEPRDDTKRENRISFSFDEGLGGFPAFSSFEEINQITKEKVLESIRFTLGSLSRDSSAKAEPDDGDDNAALTAERQQRSRVNEYLVAIPPAASSFDDIVGNRAAVEAMVEVVELPQRHGALYRAYGIRGSKGVLLHGPPGCGKTMLARAAAATIAGSNERADGKLLLVKGPELQTKWVGETEAIIRNIFAYAKAYRRRFRRPLMIFIDEADALLPARGGTGSRPTYGYEESAVATFLAEMDGLEESGAFVVLATNRPDAIDEALLRDGRCDRKIRVERPREEEVRELLRRGLAASPLAEGESAERLASCATEQLFDPLRRLLTIRTDRGTDWLCLSSIVSGALVVGIVDKAKTIAFQRDVAAAATVPSGIGPADLEAAIDMVTRENSALGHADAVFEFVQKIGAEEIIAVERITATG